MQGIREAVKKLIRRIKKCNGYTIASLNDYIPLQLCTFARFALITLELTKSSIGMLIALTKSFCKTLEPMQVRERCWEQKV